jgi:SEC-C motif domain protein
MTTRGPGYPMLPRLQMPEDTPCPCGAGRSYADCCEPFIHGTALPETAEALMRSRYTAYTRGDAAYLGATWHPTTRRQDPGLDEPVKWQGLTILATQAGGVSDREGKVEFVARYKLGGRAYRLHELSRFRRHHGRWYYVDGEMDPRPNDQASGA